MNILLPNYAEKLFQPYRYKVLYGGRGGAKSETVGRILLIKGSHQRRRVLCSREFQNSIKDSVHKLLADIIESNPELESHYTVTENRIVGKNGTEFIFKGVRHNTDSIKSMKGITDLWIEEGHTISQSSWDILIPTIREPGSEIYVTYNPKNEDDPVHDMFVINDPPPKSLVKKVSWRDNPWFSDELKMEKDHLFKVNPEKAMHVWEGDCMEISDAQILKGKYRCAYMDVKPRDHEWTGPFFGADWGYNDPTVLVKMWIYKVPGSIGQGTLYIQSEAYKEKVELNHIPDLFDTIDGSRLNKIKADNSRPETISHIRAAGFDIESAAKWPGSVEDGIAFLKGFDEVVISPDCPETLIEAKKYSYKQNKITEKILDEPVDAFNHCIDACRYGLGKLIQLSKNQTGNFVDIGEDYSDSLVSQSTTLEW